MANYLGIDLDPIESGYTPEKESSGREYMGVSLDPVGYEVEEAKPSTVLGEIPRGLKAGVQQLRGFGYGLGALAGEATGAKPLTEWAREGLADVEEKTPKPAVGSISDIESVSDVGKYLAYGVATNLPNMLLSFTGGGLGAVIGKGLVGTAARSAITKAAEKAILERGLKFGALSGAGAASLGMEAGSIAGDQLTETGQVEPLRAMAGAIPAAILDVIPEWYLAKRLGWLGKDIAKMEGNRAVRALKIAGQQFAMEAPTEAMQSVLERAAVPGKSLTNAEAWDEYINSFILGGATGGVVGGVGGVFTRKADTSVQKTLERDPFANEIETSMAEMAEENEIIKPPRGTLDSAVQPAPSQQITPETPAPAEAAPPEAQWAEEAQKVGVRFDGIQEGVGNIPSYPVFTDPVTKSSFGLQEGESLPDALTALRAKFEEAKAPEQVVTPKQEIVTPPAPVEETGVQGPVETPVAAKEPWEMRSVQLSNKNAEDIFPLNSKVEVKGGKPIYTYSTTVKWGDTEKTFEIEAKSQPTATIMVERLHKKIVQQALSEGKPVPPEVLADYPDLQKREKEAPGVAATRTKNAEVKARLSEPITPERMEIINKLEENARSLSKKDEFASIPVRGYNLSPSEQQELSRRGITFDVDRMGEPQIRLSKEARINELRTKVTAKRKLPDILARPRFNTLLREEDPMRHALSEVWARGIKTEAGPDGKQVIPGYSWVQTDAIRKALRDYGFHFGKGLNTKGVTPDELAADISEANTGWTGDADKLVNDILSLPRKGDKTFGALETKEEREFYEGREADVIAGERELAVERDAILAAEGIDAGTITANRNTLMAALEEADGLEPGGRQYTTGEIEQALGEIMEQESLREAELAAATFPPKSPGREWVDTRKDAKVGQNAAGEQLYQRDDGSVYRMRMDREGRTFGYPDFGGDLAPVETAPPAAAAPETKVETPPGEIAPPAPTREAYIGKRETGELQGIPNDFNLVNPETEIAREPITGKGLAPTEEMFEKGEVNVAEPRGESQLSNAIRSAPRAPYDSLNTITDRLADDPSKNQVVPKGMRIALENLIMAEIQQNTGELGGQVTQVAGFNIGEGIFEIERSYGKLVYNEATGEIGVIPAPITSNMAAQAAKFGVDKTLLLQTLSKDIVNNDLSGTIANETIQNSLDSFTAGQKDKTIDITIESKYDDVPETVITVTDNGRGMTASEVRRNLLRLGAKGKTGTETRGGYGLAKAGFLLAPRRAEITTTKQGMQTVLKGTREQFFGVKGAGDPTIETTAVGTDYPNGTTFKLYFYSDHTDAEKDNAYPLTQWAAKSAFDKYIERGIFVDGVTINYLDGDYRGQPASYESRHPSKLPQVYKKADFDIRGNDLTVYFVEDPNPKNKDWGGKYKPRLITLNKGLALFGIEERQYDINGMWAQPNWRVIVDFNKTPDVRDINYPFIRNRTQMNGEISTAVSKIINEKIKSLNDADFDLQKADFAEMVAKSPVINGIRVLIPFKDQSEFDKAAQLLADNNLLMSDLAGIFNSFKAALAKIGGKEIDLTMTVDPKVHGYRSNPEIVGHEFYAINPFAVTGALELMPIFKELTGAGYDTNQAMASNLVHVFVHEYTHNEVGEHHEIFTIALARNYMKLTHGVLARLEQQARRFYEQHGKVLDSIQGDLSGMGKGGSRFQTDNINVYPAREQSRGVADRLTIQGTGERSEVIQAEMAETNLPGEVPFRTRQEDALVTAIATLRTGEKKGGYSIPNIIAKYEEATGDKFPYPTMPFLVKLGTTVSFDAKKIVNKESAAVYDADLNQIIFNEGTLENASDPIAKFQEVMAHESLHAILTHLRTLNMPAYIEFKARMNGFAKELNQHLDDASYQTQRMFEYYTEKSMTDDIVNLAFTNKDFAKWLNSIPSERKVNGKSTTLWGRLKDIILKAIGKVSGATKLDELNDILDTVLGDVVEGKPITANTPGSFSQFSLINPPSTNQPASWDSPEKTPMSNFIYTFIDRQTDLRNVVRAIKKVTGDIKDIINPDLRERLYAGTVAEKTKQYLEREFSPLIQDLMKNNVKVDDFEEYLWYRTAEETNKYIASLGEDHLQDGGSGKTTAEARKYLASLDPKTKAIYEKLAAQTDRMLAINRDLAVSYQLESQDTVDKWAQTYRHYAPLFRADVEAGVGTGEGFSVTGPVSRRRKGSTRPVVDILAHIAEQRERIIARGEKNRIATALYGLAKANPNPDYWKLAKPTVVERLNVETGEMVKVLDMSYLNKDNVVMSRQLDPKTGKIIQRGVEFNEKNPSAERMAKALKNIDMDTLGQILGISAKVTRFIASMNTQYNPIFGAVNFVRDLQFSMLSLSSTPLAGKQKQIWNNTFPALKAIYTDLRSKDKAAASKDPWAALWEDFREHGGPTGYRDLFRTTKDRAEAIKKEILLANPQTLIGKATIPVSRAIKGWLSDYNTAAENAVRLAAYKTGIDSGMSKDQAAVLAKSLTVDFNRKGQIATQAGALYAFFNANAQGSARMIETLRGPMGTKIIAGGITLGALQAMMLAAAGFGDDEPPEFVRERNIIIPIGGKNYVTIPMPLGFHILPNIGRITSEYALNGFKAPAKKVGDLTGVIVESFNPMGASGLSLQTVTPTIIDPFAALSANKDWTGKAIYRENFSSLNPKPGFTRTKDTATWFSKKIAWALNRMTGGTEYKPGMFSPTPDEIDYLFGQATGGVGREATKFQQAAQALTGGEELPAYKIPLVGRFYGTTEGQSNEATKFYANLKKLNAHELEIKGRQKAREPVGEYLKDNPEARYWAMANKFETVVAKLSDRKRHMVERDASKDAIRNMNNLIAAQMKKMNDVIARAER